MAIKKNDLQKGPRYRARKTACRSKPPKGITLKKTQIGEIEEIGEIKEIEEIKEMGEIEEIGEIAKSKKRRSQISKKSRDVISECGSIDDYETLNEISRGSYGIVYKALDKKSGEIVAMKEELDGLSTSSLREIEILRSLNPHPRIINLKKVVTDDYDGVYIIMEYFENDLKRYTDSIITPIAIPEVKLLMKQLLEGIVFLHKNQVMHRDLKPSNILVNGAGNLKICDFGLSRCFGRSFGSKSSNVVTLWYRAPELLLGSTRYSCAIDMWSVGCIMGELVLKEVLFRGETEIEQIDKIFGVLGTPNEGVWPGFRRLPGGRAKFVQQPDNLLRRKFSEAGVTEAAGFDLLDRLLTYDPDKRITAESALNHAWFKGC